MRYFSKRHDIRKGSNESAGIDLPANLDDDKIIIKAKSSVKIKTGIHFEITDGFFGLVVPRSSIGIKRHLILQNTTGIIDSDYRGDIILSFYNFKDEDVVIKDGEYIAQMIIIPYMKTNLKKVEDLDLLNKTKRGEGGIGSTGKF